MTRDHAILALLLSPFVLCLAVIAVIAMTAVFTTERNRNPYRVSPKTREARERLHESAWEVKR